MSSRNLELALAGAPGVKVLPDLPATPAHLNDVVNVTTIDPDGTVHFGFASPFSAASGYLPLTGGTLTRPLTLPGAPTTDNQAANKKYIDDKTAAAGAGTYLPLSGGALTGPLTLSGDPLTPTQATTRNYVDTKIAAIPLLAVNSGDLPPAGQPDNALWWDSQGLSLYIRYNDGNSSQWVSTSVGLSAQYLPIYYTATGGTTPRNAYDRAADIINVLDYGAVGDGATDDTVAIQAALNAVPAAGKTVFVPRLCALSAPVKIKSNTLLLGAGSGTGFIALAALPNGPMLTNEHDTATTLTDHDIELRDLLLDYGPIVSRGSGHQVRFYFCKGVRIINCTFQVRRCANATAFLGCYDTLVDGCSAYDFSNCAYDHWQAPSYARVTNCYAESTESAQFVNFNPEATTPPSTGNIAQGFVLANCEFVSTSPGADAIQLEPLSAVTSVRNVTVANNVFRNILLSLRGDTRNVTVVGNVFDTPLGGDAVIKAHAISGVTPADIVVSGNNIINPSTVVGNSGVIRIEATNSVIIGNRVSGSGYGTVPGIYCGTEPAVISGNWVSNGVVSATNAVSSQTTYSVPRLYARPTSGLNNGSGIVGQFGDTDATSANPWMFSYTNGSTSGGSAILGTNTYVASPSGTLTRVNAGRNGWWLQHDNRNATDGDLMLRLISSGAAISTVATFEAAAGAVIVSGSLKFGTTSGANIRSGTGAPSGSFAKGSMWLRTDGAVGSTLYVTQGGGTWNAVAGV